MTQPPTDIHIRSAYPQDAELITDIYVAAWNAGFGSRLPVKRADAARIARWRVDLSDGTPTRWWLAERHGQGLGFVGIGPSRDPVDPSLGELDTIAVSPAAWHSGIGKALMAVALEALRAAGYRSALLWTLRDYPLAESFYRATGWRLNGARRDDGNQVRYDHDLS